MASELEKDIVWESRAEGTVKALLSLIPIPGYGTFLNEALFNVNARVKQRRLNRFIETLGQVLLKETSHLDMSAIEMEEKVIDLIEAVFKRAMRVSADEKHKRLARILIHGLQIDEPLDFQEHFLDLVCELNEVQVKILATHAEHTIRYDEPFHKLGEEIAKLRERNTAYRTENELNRQGLANNSSRVKKEVEILEKRVKWMQAKRAESMEARNGSFYGLDIAGYQVLIYDLIGKGLLMDLGVVLGEFKAGEVMSITPYGRAFLDFLMEHPEGVTPDTSPDAQATESGLS